MIRNLYNLGSDHFNKVNTHLTTYIVIKDIFWTLFLGDETVNEVKERVITQPWVGITSGLVEGKRD